MSHFAQKRKRPPPNAIPRKKAILIAFDEALDNNGSEKKMIATTLDWNGFASAELRRSHLSRLCDRLVCVSMDDGPSRLSSLKNEMRKRIWGKADLASLLFSEEEVDLGPTLCVAVHLLRERCVYFADINASYIPERALFELVNPQVCLCRGTHGGVKSITHYLLDESRESRCASVLKEFLSIFFRDESVSFCPSNETPRFRLAAFVVDILCKEWTSHGLRVNTVVQWVRQAVVPSHFLDHPVQDDLSVFWTAELSGLATCRRVDEYLACGKCEEQALIALFNAIPADKASAVYLECVNDVLKIPLSDVDNKEPVTGTWSRIILLGNRISDKEVFQDVGEDLRRRVVSSINGALCSPTCYSNSRSIAILLCLARRVVIHGKDGNLDHPNALERYYAWFRDLISVSDDKLVQAVLEPMTHLIPLETLSILKLNHRVFSANKRHFRLASDYLSCVRSRIRESDTSLSQTPSIDLGEEQQNFDNPPLKSMVEIVQFVARYSKSDGKLPDSLLRQMNFNRFYFRRFIMPILLNPNFVTLKPSEGEVDLGMSAEIFDQRRIELIEEIGFKRKDHAITVAEARKSIAGIKAANQKRENNVARTAEEKQELASAHIEEESSLCDIITAVLKDEAVHGFNATQLFKDGSQVQNVKDILCTKLNALTLKSKDQNDLAQLATEVLQSLSKALETVESENSNLFSFSDVTTKENLLQPYNEFWSRTGCSLLSLMFHMFGRSQLSNIQSEIRTQLFALLCFRIGSLTDRSLLALAMVTASLIFLQQKSVLCDLCFVHQKFSPMKMKHIASAIFECLPLSTPQSVRGSSAFAVYTISLLMGCTGSEILFMDPQLEDIDFTKSKFLGYENFLVECIKPLQHMVQWVITSPWRMNVSKDGNEDFLMNCSPLESGKVFRNAVHLHRELTVSSSLDELLIGFLSVEIRCGWGLWPKITAFLRDLEFHGMTVCSIVHKTILFLVQTQTYKYNGRRVGWVERGLLVFYDESNYDMNAMHNDDSAVFNVENCIQLHGGSLSFQMAEYYRLMEFDYFLGCTDVHSHVQSVLVNVFWPLPKRFVSYILRCLDKVELNLSANLNVFFIGNCAALYQGYPSTIQNDRDHRETCNPRQQIQELSATLRILVSPENLNIEADDMYNGMKSVSDINKMIAKVGLKQAFELGIAFGLYISRMYSFNPCVGAMLAKVKSVIALISTKAGNIICSDVLDSALITCALLPFGRIDDDTEGRSECAQRTNEALQVLVSERIMLCDNDRMGPFWFRMRLSDDSWKANSNDLQLLKNWRAETASLCLVRILSTVGFMNEACTKVMMRLIGQDLLLSVVLPNLIWAYSLVSTMGEAWAASIRSGLVLGVEKLSCLFVGITRGDIIASLPACFETIGVEIFGLFKTNEKLERKQKDDNVKNVGIS